jgi:hypothetical protein
LRSKTKLIKITRNRDKNGEMALIRNREKDLKIRQDFKRLSWKETIG